MNDACSSAQFLPRGGRAVPSSCWRERNAKGAFKPPDLPSGVPSHKEAGLGGTYRENSADRQQLSGENAPLLGSNRSE